MGLAISLRRGFLIAGMGRILDQGEAIFGRFESRGTFVDGNLNLICLKVTRCPIRRGVTSYEELREGVAAVRVNTADLFY